MFLSLIIFAFCGIVLTLARPSTVLAPPFLVKAPEGVQKSFDEMIGKVGDLTDAQIEDSVEQWIRKQSDDVQFNYIKFKRDRELYEAAAAIQKQKMLARMSPLARSAYTEIYTIYTHPILTASEKLEIIEKIMNTLPYEVRQEIPL